MICVRQPQSSLVIDESPVPSKPFVSAPMPFFSTQTWHPCGCWEECADGNTHAYGRCEEHNEVVPDGN